MRLSTQSLLSLTLLTAVVAFTACGDTATSSPATTATTTASGTGATAAAPTFTRTSDVPEEALGVFDARKETPGSTIQMIGRVQRVEEGLAAFRLIDDELAWCGRGENACGCKTPWDYCCADPTARQHGMIPVELRSKSGEPLFVSRDTLGLRELDLVGVEGKLEKTESGGLVLVVTNGYFRRDRPEIDGITWPN